MEVVHQPRVQNVCLEFGNCIASIICLSDTKSPITGTLLWSGSLSFNVVMVFHARKSKMVVEQRPKFQSCQDIQNGLQIQRKKI